MVALFGVCVPVIDGEVRREAIPQTRHKEGKPTYIHHMHHDYHQNRGTSW
jgi:hypothetical protein